MMTVIEKIFWDYSSGFGWLKFLADNGIITQEQEPELEAIHDWFITLHKAEKQARYNLSKEVAEFSIEIKESDLWPDLKKTRVTFLEEDNRRLTSEIKTINDNVRKFEAQDCTSDEIELYRHLIKFDDIKQKQKINNGELKSLTTNVPSTRITPDVLALAKAYPMQDIIKCKPYCKDLIAICPYHNDENPSFVVYRDSNRGNCFTCGKNVNVVELVMHEKKMNYREAVAFLT